MNPSFIEMAGTICFAIAVIHTFTASYFQNLAHHYKEGSMGENFFHLLGDVEVVFGIWSAIFLTIFSFKEGFAVYDEAHHVIGGALHYLESQNFTEPAFVFVIMCMAATRPIIILAEKSIFLVSKILPLPGKIAFYVSALVVGPILGSFITEPAAMTVTALILLNYFYTYEMSEKFKYATLGLLFVNISIGGTLTHFAAPPVLMVATKYGWGLQFMMFNFGWKAVIAILINTAVITFAFRKELTGNLLGQREKSNMFPPWWMFVLHVLFLGAVVMTAHHIVFFLGLFLFFLGFLKITEEYQTPVKLRESLMVGFFLGGLVVLGSIQKWWLQEILVSLGDLPLYFGATGLTAITDNAALTYLGSLVDLSDTAKYFIVAGAVTGGGLTVIANAPNPAGYGILKASFKDGTIKPVQLLLWALFPTAVAAVCFLVLPNLF
jgi:hypothetical protein